MDKQDQAKERRCLRCQKMFMSQSPGNRICPRCTANPPNIGGLRHIVIEGDMEGRADDN